MSDSRGRGLLLSFVAVLSSPLVVQLATPPTTDAGGENRELAAAPEPPASWEEMWAFPAAVDAYLDDRFGLRDDLVRANARVRHTLGASADDRVIVGRDGWLFFAGDDVPDQVLGRRQFDQERRRAFDAYLDAIVARADAVGARVVVTVAPNKAAIHRGQLPDWLASGPRVAPELEQFQELVRARDDVELVDLHRPLQRAAEQQQVYRALDTHWNDLGGFVAYRELWDAIAGPEAGLHAEDVTFEEVEEGGDLVGMLGLEGELTEPVATAVDLPVAPMDGPSVVQLRDSFGRRLERFLEASSPQVHSVHHRLGAQSLDVIDEESPDVVVLELVERDLRRTWGRGQE